MTNDDMPLLTGFGKIVSDHFLAQTLPGCTFLLAIDSETFQALKDKVGSSIERALKSTGWDGSSIVRNEWICVAVTALQVTLIYDMDNIGDDSFYDCLKNYYGFPDNQAVLNYLKDSCRDGKFQEILWGKAKEHFKKKNRILVIPPPKNGSGRYVQYPKSQMVISNRQIIDFADKFERLKLSPYMIFSFKDFSERVFSKHPVANLKPIEGTAYTDRERIAQTLVFSFYCQWDGRSSGEIRNKKPRNAISKTNRLREKTEIFIQERDSKLYFRQNGKKVSIKTEIYFHELFSSQLTASFVYDEEYDDWQYHSSKQINKTDRVLILVLKKVHQNNWYIEKKRDDLSSDEIFYVFIFDECNEDIADYIGFKFIDNIFIVQGGIKAKSDVGHRADFLGTFYNFALPKIRIAQGDYKQIFIDSESITIENNKIDLDCLELSPGEHSIKCWDTTPAFFVIEMLRSRDAVDIVSGWIISSKNFYPADSIEYSRIHGLIFDFPEEENNIPYLRPFLSQQERLERNSSITLIDRKIENIEQRRRYGN
jgi:hypothetical protein